MKGYLKTFDHSCAGWRGWSGNDKSMLAVNATVLTRILQ